MWTAKLKSSLAVIFLSCVLFIESDARANGVNNGVFNSASAYATAGASAGGISALNSANTFSGGFEGTENFPDTYNRQKEIRSYDNSGFPYSNNNNRRIGSYGAPTEYDVSQDYGIKNRDRDYNKNDCSKCKWENDDYWEREEPEEEEEEKNDDECDDGNDGQYGPDKTHHHGGNKPKVDGLPSPGVRKTGPTNVYEDRIKANAEPGPKSYANTNFPSNIGYTEPANAFGTQEPRSRWNTGVTPSNFGSSTRPSWQNRPHRFDESSGTTPISGNWNTRFDDFPTMGYPSSQKPVPSWNVDHTSVPAYGSTPSPWNAEHSSTPDGNFGRTPKPENWHTGSNDRPEATWNPSYGNKPAGTTSCTQQGSNCIGGKQLPVKVGAPPVYPGFMKPEFPRGSGYNQPSGIECSQEGSHLYEKCIFTPTGTPEPTHKGTSVTSSFGSTPPKERFGFGHTEGHPYGVDKPTGTRTPYDNKPYDGVTQSNPVVGTSSRTPESTISDNKFGYDIKPHTASPKNRYGSGSTTDVSSTIGTTRAPHRGIGSNRNDPRGQSNIYNLGKFPKLPTGSEVYGRPRVTKPGNGSTSRPMLSSSPRDRTELKPDFTTETGTFGYDSTSTNMFKTPYGTQRSPSITVTTPFYDTSRHQAGGSKYPPQGSFGNRPMYETTPHIGNSEDVNKPWPSRRPGTGSETWPSQRPDIGSGTWPNRQSEGGRETWPARQPAPGSGIGTRPSGHPREESANWPNKKLDDVNGAWPNQQPETGSGTWPARQPAPGSGIGTRPSGHPREESANWPNKKLDDVNGAWPNQQPETGSGTWPARQPESGTGVWLSRQPEGGSGNWPSRKPNDGSESWPGDQSGRRNHPFDVKPIDSSSKCGEGNYNCPNIGSEDGCNGRDTPSGNGPCRGLVNGPSGVNKTYYPTGTNDDNVRNIGNTYKPNTPFNIGSDSAYPLPGRGCRIGDNSCNRGGIGVTDSGPVKWNPQNPFLYGAGGGTPSDVSRPWNIGTTDKPVGVGNPFLDSGWNIPNPGYGVGNENKNVIPLGGTDTKPISQNNPFLYDNKQRDDIGSNQRVIPLGEKVPAKINPFLRPPGDDYTNPTGHGVTGDKKNISKTYSHNPSYADGSRVPGGSNYGNVKTGVFRGGIPPQRGNYPTGGSFQDNTPPQCKLGLFGCGAPGSGSYATTKIGTDNNFGRTNWPSSEETNYRATNSWGSASASAYAGSYSGSWSGNHPVKVEG